MQPMMNNNYISFLLFCLFIIIGQTLFSQTSVGNITSSPYSLYGLGVSNDFSTGKTNALGKTGFALSTNFSINNLNPASLGAIPKGAFLYDIGLKLQRGTVYEDGIEESRLNVGFSNMAIAFSLSEKAGISFTLIPFTSVGYAILGVENQIDGSTNTFLTNITGTGGLNNVKINYGYSLNKKLRLGLSSSFLFGAIKENEIDIIESTLLNISEENFYSGFKFGLGFQYELNNKFTIGGVANFSTKLNGEQKRIVLSNGLEISKTEDNLEAFKLPIEIGIGLQSKLTKKLSFNLDYKKSFWTVTEQSDLVGNYIDQDFIGLGLEYVPKNNSFNYWERVNYRTGLNFDNGNFEVEGNRINNFSFNLGLGLPINKRNYSMLNFSYSYGQKGQVSNGLIKENYHTITLNFSFNDFWFKKRLLN